MSKHKLLVLIFLPQILSSPRYHYATTLTRTPKLEESIPEDPNIPQKRLTQSINKFSNRIYRHMSNLSPDYNEDNLVYSPISMFTSLTTLQFASVKETKSELAQVLSLTKINDTVVQDGLSSILSTYDKSVNLLNRVFLDHSFVPSNKYVNKVRDKLNGEVVQTHFSNATAASLFVNDHVYESSHGVLENVISVDLPDTTEQSVIDGGIMAVSGLTFEGDWERAFTPLLTRKEYFVREDGSRTEVEMMHRDGVYGYAEIPELNGTVLSIKYKHGRYSFNVVLPEEGTSISELEDNLESFPFNAVMSRLTRSYVQVSLPKFQVESTVDLVDVMEKLGIRRVFSEEAAQFGKLVDGVEDGDVYLTNCVHKVVVDVREGGSRASSQNFIEAVPAQSRVLTPFTANRPFVFFVSDSLLNSVLLVGRKVV